MTSSGGARNESKGGYFSLTKNQGGRSLFLVGGARDWINHKLIEIDGLRQPESDSSPNRLQTPATGRRSRP